MPYVHDIATRIGGRRASACFYVERPRVKGRHLLPIPRVHQLDGHSCGFLAALVTVRYFDPAVSVIDVLRAVPRNALPSPTRGLSEHKMRCTLARFGIESPNLERLGWAKLLKATKEGHPVIVTILPPEWDCDHWAVIRGMKDNPRRVWLSNYGEVEDGCLSWHGFKSMWYPHGEGMVCRRK